jgi:hypothetical protein
MPSPRIRLSTMMFAVVLVAMAITIVVQTIEIRRLNVVLVAEEHRARLELERATLLAAQAQRAAAVSSAQSPRTGAPSGSPTNSGNSQLPGPTGPTK